MYDPVQWFWLVSSTLPRPQCAGIPDIPPQCIRSAGSVECVRRHRLPFHLCFAHHSNVPDRIHGLLAAWDVCGNPRGPVLIASTNAECATLLALVSLKRPRRCNDKPLRPARCTLSALAWPHPARFGPNSDEIMQSLVTAGQFRTMLLRSSEHTWSTSDGRSWRPDLA